VKILAIFSALQTSNLRALCAHHFFDQSPSPQGCHGWLSQRFDCDGNFVGRGWHGYRVQNPPL